jgi:hypothetical protein
MVREGTVFLLDALAGDKPEEAALQTKLLEINLVTNPQVGNKEKKGVTRVTQAALSVPYTGREHLEFSGF